MSGRRWSPSRAARAWLGSPLFLRQARDFLLLWVVLKAVNAATAGHAGLAPFAFRPASEAAALGIECFALHVFLRRARELVLLANLGLGLPSLLLPFVVLHAVLSGVLAALR